MRPTGGVGYVAGMGDGVLYQYTVYCRPADATPQRPFAVRQWLIGAGTVDLGWVRYAGSLDAARVLVPVSADYRVPRSADDDPTIVETWT